MNNIKKHRKTRSIEPILNAKIQGISCDKQFDCLQDEERVNIYKFHQIMTTKRSESKRKPNIFSQDKDNIKAKLESKNIFLTLNNTKRNYYNSMKHTSSHEVTPKRRVKEKLFLNNIDPCNIKQDNRSPILPQINTVRLSTKSIKDLCRVNKKRQSKCPRKSKLNH